MTLNVFRIRKDYRVHRHDSSLQRDRNPPAGQTSLSHTEAHFRKSYGYVHLKKCIFYYSSAQKGFTYPSDALCVFWRRLL